MVAEAGTGHSAGGFNRVGFQQIARMTPPIACLRTAWARRLWGELNAYELFGNGPESGRISHVASRFVDLLLGGRP